MKRVLCWSTMMCLLATPVGAENPKFAAAEAKARALVEGWSKGAFAESVEMFDPTMVQAMPVSKIEGLWGQLTSQLLGFKTITGTASKQTGPYLQVRVSCTFGMQAMDILVIMNDSGQVSGLRVVPPLVVASARPQTPKPPFPYSARDVLYPNPFDGSKIGGTLTIPPGKGPHPAVLLITGSGAQDRDETIFEHKPFWVIADHLSRAGFAVLRVDDRGVGATTGDATKATIQVHATDVEAGVAFLTQQPEVDGGRIGLIGHSEGGIIASIVAARQSAVRFIVLLAGPGVPGTVLNVQQVDALLPAESREAPGARKAVLAAQSALNAAIAGDRPDGEIRSLLEAALAAGDALSGPKGVALTPESRAQRLEAQYQAVRKPWFRSFLKTDPAVALRQVKVPVLALVGEKDIQVPAKQNLAAIGHALAVAGNGDVELHALPGLNHLFQKAETGHVREYETITETFNPGALALMTQWLRVRARLEKADQKN